MRGFDGKRRVVFRDQVLLDAPRSEARHEFGVTARQGQARADDVRRVVHGRQPFPIARPAQHFLLVRGAQILDAAHLAGFVQLFDVQKLARVDDGFHHHVVLAGLGLGSDDLFQLGDLVAAGTVQATCLPAFSPAMLILACSWIGVLMCTASTLGS